MQIDLPYKFTPRPYQKPFLNAFRPDPKTGKAPARRAVICWNRRAGKDKTTLNLTIQKMMERVGVYYYFFPTYGQGKRDLWDNIDAQGMKFLDHFPPQLIRRKNDTDMKIELVNGSIFQIIGTEDPDRIVGSNPVGCVFSEYSVQNPKAWELVSPILAENGGWAIFVFTPRGRNHGWQILKQAQELAKNPDSGWFWQVLTVDDTKCISAQALEEERLSKPEAFFKQEYYCNFVESSGALFRRIEENVYEDVIEPTQGHTYQLGVDLAKYNDWTVLTPIDLQTFKVGRLERFNQVDWNLQKARVEAVARRYNNANVWMDSSGLGDPLFDDLKLRGLNVEGYKFTSKSKEALLINLSTLLEQDKIKIPNDPILISELQGMQYVQEETNSGKQITKIVSLTEHDDTVMSLALAVWGLKEPQGFLTQDFGLYSTTFK